MPLHWISDERGQLLWPAECVLGGCSTVWLGPAYFQVAWENRSLDPPGCAWRGANAGTSHWQLLAPKMRFEIFAPDLCLAVGGLGICGGDARRHGVSRLDVAG